jgi:hypothetical protein
MSQGAPHLHVEFRPSPEHRTVVVRHVKGHHPPRIGRTWCKGCNGFVEAVCVTCLGWSCPVCRAPVPAPPFPQPNPHLGLA